MHLGLSSDAPPNLLVFSWFELQPPTSTLSSLPFFTFCVISIPLQAHPRTHPRGKPESSILQSRHQQSAGDHRQLSGSAQGHFSIPHETKLKAAYISLCQLMRAWQWRCGGSAVMLGYIVARPRHSAYRYGVHHWVYTQNHESWLLGLNYKGYLA